MGNPSGYWFPAKTYGWGWGLPLTWQGWVALLAYGVVLVGAAYFLDARAKPMLYAACVLIATAVLIGVCWLKGEPPGWRWG